MSSNTLFLRLEGPLQAWGSHESKFLVRRTLQTPSRSGVCGLLCAALGVPRKQAPVNWIPRLNALQMGVRVDRPGIRWWDYHTVGAGLRMRIAKGEGKRKSGAMLTRREYLCDASFLVALQGDSGTIAELESALNKPVWTPYLGRKCCPPSRPILEQASENHDDITPALCAVPWRKRMRDDDIPQSLECYLDWRPTPEEPEAPTDALVWYDMPITLQPPSHRPRFVIRRTLSVGEKGQVTIAPEPLQRMAHAPLRPRADYSNTEYRQKRKERLTFDQGLCVFCKSPATTVQHITYRHAGGRERIEELRALCRLCHDAVTMIEYGEGMGMDRINPEDPQWRERIISKRADIIAFRSLETRRKKLAEEVVE